MVKKKYVPNRGDLVWLNFDPSFGHEQKGRRPAIVLSPKIYNEKSGLMLACPITSTMKGYPFEVAVEKKGVILADQIKSIAWKERNVKFITLAPKETLIEVLDKVRVLLEI